LAYELDKYNNALVGDHDTGYTHTKEFFMELNLTKLITVEQGKWNKIVITSLFYLHFP
jgi:hypothetical protein